MFYVYTIFNTINGKIYVGQSTDKYRWQRHKYASFNLECDGSKMIHRAMAKHGIYNFVFKIIQYFSSLEEALAAEIYWIAFYKSNACRYKNGLGYNLTDGGESTLGLKWTDESRVNFSKQVSGENNNAAILSTDDIIEIKTMLLTNISTKIIAEKFKITRHYVCDIRRGKAWSHLSITDNLDDIERMTRHGNIGKVASEETRAKMSKNRKKENLSIKTRKKLSVSHQGARHFGAKITEKQAKKIKKLLKNGIRPIDISRSMNISKHIVYSISGGNNWKHLK